MIIPARNAQSTIGETLESILSNGYRGPVEVIVADGSDDSATGEVVRRIAPEARLIPNPQKITSCGLNAALRATASPVIVRCDAHVTLPQGYLNAAVAVLRRTGAANVGGRQLPVGHTWFTRANALAMTSILGSGNACYRHEGPAGPTDTVYLGVFRRSTLEAVGGFNKEMRHNQDYELNWRLRETGQTVWFDFSLYARYRPRTNLAQTALQYFRYGWWKQKMLQIHPRSARLRQVMAPLLVAGLITSLALGIAGYSWAVVPPLAYLLVLVGGSLAAGIKGGDLAAAVLVPVILATMHIAWGLGFLVSGAAHWAGRMFRPSRRRADDK